VSLLPRFGIREFRSWLILGSASSACRVGSSDWCRGRCRPGLAAVDASELSEPRKRIHALRDDPEFGYASLANEAREISSLSESPLGLAVHAWSAHRDAWEPRAIALQ
jgi:hypothetical protein